MQLIVNRVASPIVLYLSLSHKHRLFSKCVMMLPTAWLLPVLMVILFLIGQSVALECHFCAGIDRCNVSRGEVQSVTCTDEIVRLTNESLASFIPSLASVRRKDREEFQCIHVRATSLADVTFLFIRGCVYATRSDEFCDLRYASFRGTRDCVACDHEDLCNNITISGSAWKTPAGSLALVLVNAVSAIIFAFNRIYR
ncbi:uncharacterized protein LOC129778915 [Toxorhynchites rutilus septentrionalis]|uniref:uncharacterized protein LOC129778915 n=1 Tax=Toxorhynchites rutilus septentrionalis TaxID=329112 RepID=UPI002478CE08|nr:uncharacterized protein LOC129778915 [Toxorhynchites rutilus septentrionalis]